MAFAIEDDAGCAGVNQAGHPVPAHCRQHVFSAKDIRLEIFIPRSPDARFGRGVDDGVAACNRARDGDSIGKVSLKNLNFSRPQLRLRSAPETAHALASNQELCNNLPTEKPAAAGDKNAHK